MSRRLSSSCLSKLNSISLLSRVEELRWWDYADVENTQFKMKHQLSASALMVLKGDVFTFVSGDDAAHVIIWSDHPNVTSHQKTWEMRRWRLSGCCCFFKELSVYRVVAEQLTVAEPAHLLLIKTKTWAWTPTRIRGSRAQRQAEGIVVQWGHVMCPAETVCVCVQQGLTHTCPALPVSSVTSLVVYLCSQWWSQMQQQLTFSLASYFFSVWLIFHLLWA